MTASATWNERTAASDDLAGGRAEPGPGPGDHEPAHVVIGEMAGLLLDTRARVVTDACLLAAVTVGFALEAGLSARVRRPGPAGVINLGLLAGIVCCWLVAVFLLARASRPVLGALGRLRWATGAPIDPRPAWVTLPPVGADPAQWTWNRAYLLLAAARGTAERMRWADTWTCFTGGCFPGSSPVLLLRGGEL